MGKLQSSWSRNYGNAIIKANLAHRLESTAATS
jgi:hypothetical protein